LIFHQSKKLANLLAQFYGFRSREAVLNMYIFETLEEVRTQTEKWLDVYNQHRPHDSLGNLSPIEYLQKFNPETVI